MDHPQTIAYFCMEIGHHPEMPTYSGGLGVLAGDTLRSAADLSIPMVGVTLLHRKGYFRQILDSAGNQQEEPSAWVVSDFLSEVSARVTVTIDGRTVRIRAWTCDVLGCTGFRVPVYFLDTQLEENSDWDRSLTHFLYGGDSQYRLCQEIVLGIGGIRLLRALGFGALQRYHINEGHASLLTVELLDEQLRQSGHADPRPEDEEAIRRKCVFTTHTPVPAGHDEHPAATVTRLLEPRAVNLLEKLACLSGALNMTHLALKLSHYVNGVSLRHGEVSRRLFAPRQIDAITNGVHAPTWVCPALRELFDRHIPDWRTDSFALRRAVRIPDHELWTAHMLAKERLLDYVNRTTSVAMDRSTFTIGFARRAATYKRADLLFEDMERLKKIHSEVGPIQLLFAGKAHPHDQQAKDLIRRVFHAKSALQHTIRMAYLDNYDMYVGGLLTAGVDLWLNNPEPPLEASGTSGMKAAMNGVPSLSVLDGWWVEGWVEGVTGWAIGRDEHKPGIAADRHRAAAFLYDKLEYVILPMFYHQRDGYIDVMRHAVALNGSYFSTHRMVQQYVIRAYMP